MARKIEVAITGDARSLERAFRQSGRSADSFGKKITRGAGAGLLFLGKTAAVGAAAGLAITTVGLVKAAKAASESEASTARLNQQLKTLGKDNDAVRTSIDQTVTSLSNLSGFDDEDLQDAFTSLVRSSGNVELSMSNLGIAADIAASGTMSLEAATKLLNRVNAGSVTALKRYGIEVDKNTTKQEALRLLQQKFAGQAEAFGQTAAGAQARLAVAFENAFEEIGVALTPVIADLANLATEYLPGIARSVSQYLGAAKDEILEFVDAFRTADGIEGKARLVFEIGKNAIMDLVDTLLAQMRKVDWKETGQVILAGIVSAATTANVTFGNITEKIAQSMIDNMDVIAEAGALMALAIIDRLSDPTFWYRHWELVLTVALSALPMGRIATIGFRILRVFAKPLLNLGKVIRPTIARAFDDVLTDVAGIIRRVGLAIVFGLNSALLRARKTIFDGLRNALDQAETTILNNLARLFTAVYNRVRDPLESLLGYTYVFVENLRRLFYAVGDFIRFGRGDNDPTGLIRVFRDVLSFPFMRIQDLISDFLVSPMGNLIDAGRGAYIVMNRFFVLLDDVVVDVLRLGKAIVTGLEAPFKLLNTTILPGFAARILRLADGIQNARPVIVKAARDLASSIANNFIDTLSDVLGMFPSVVRTLIRFGISSAIVDAGISVYNSATALGSSIIDGISKGITDKANALTNSLTGVVKDAVAYVKRNVLNSQSPSKWTMAQLGFPMIDGVVEGVKGRRAILRQTLGDVFKSAVDAARSQVSSLSGILGSMLDRISSTKVSSMVSAGALTGGKTLAEIRSEQARVEREREKARLEKAVNDAQSDEERQQALQDLSDWEINEEARLLEEKMALAEKSYADDIANLQDSFDRGLISAETFKTELEKIVGAETGKLLGEQFAAAFGQTLTTLISTLSGLASAGVGGEGIAPISPVGEVTGAVDDYKRRKKQFDNATAEWKKERDKREDALQAARTKARKANSPGGTDVTAAEQKEIDRLRERFESHVGKKPKASDFGLQRGGIVMSPIQTWLGENNQSEAVIPLDSGRGQRMLKTALSAGGGSTAGNNVTVNVTVNGNEFSAREFARLLKPELDRVVGFSQV